FRNVPLALSRSSTVRKSSRKRSRQWRRLTVAAGMRRSQPFWRPTIVSSVRKAIVCFFRVPLVTTSFTSIAGESLNGQSPGAGRPDESLPGGGILPPEYQQTDPEQWKADFSASVFPEQPGKSRLPLTKGDRRNANLLPQDTRWGK